MSLYQNCIENIEKLLELGLRKRDIAKRVGIEDVYIRRVYLENMGKATVDRIEDITEVTDRMIQEIQDKMNE